MKKIFLFCLITLVSCNPKSSTNQEKILDATIMNGKLVKIEDSIASSVVGIYDSKVNGICTGSLIAPNIVMTAAHCVPSRAQDVKIIFSTNINKTLNIKEQDGLHELFLPAVDFRVGPTWDPKNDIINVDTGDIALIKFKGNIPKGYKPATFLKDGSDLKIGQMVTLAGFGVDSVDMEEIDPKKYRKLDEAIEFGEVICSGKNKGNYGTCYKIEKNGDGPLRTASAPISFVHETEIRLNEKNAGTCNGDSGGPAYIQKDGQYFLFGVTSRGSDFCNEVGIYTNAIYYKTWIEDSIKAFEK